MINSVFVIPALPAGQNQAAAAGKLKAGKVGDGAFLKMPRPQL